MKVSILIALVGVGFVATGIFLAFNFIPTLNTSEKFSVFVDPVIVKDSMGTETHVTIKNTGTNTLTNLTIHYGGSVKPEIIPILNPGEKISLSPPEGSNLEEIRVTSDEGINVTQPFRTPASANFVGNSGFGG